jgi:hypothetical protein
MSGENCQLAPGARGQQSLVAIAAVLYSATACYRLLNSCSSDEPVDGYSGSACASSVLETICADIWFLRNCRTAVDSVQVVPAASSAGRLLQQPAGSVVGQVPAACNHQSLNGFIALKP